MITQKKSINLLFADNGSTDNTKKLLSNFMKKYGNEFYSVKLIDVPRISKTDNKFLQIANVMNALFKNAETDIINIDSDVIPPTNSISKLLFINEEKKANICGGITAFIIPNGGKLIPVLNSFFLDSKNKCFINVAEKFLDQYGTLNLPFMKLEVDSCGFALCFIEKSVFKRLKCHVDSWNTSSNKQNTLLCPNIRFCIDAKSLGYRIMIDTSLYFKHPTIIHEVHIHKNGIEIRYSG